MIQSAFIYNSPAFPIISIALCVICVVGGFCSEVVCDGKDYWHKPAPTVGGCSMFGAIDRAFDYQSDSIG
jgi:hypothetical protein